MNAFVKSQLITVNSLLDRWMERREKEVQFPVDVELIRDIPYMASGKRCHMMDIYRPRNSSSPLPVIVNLHGGGIVLCTKEVNRPFCAELARRGFLVFCLDYPLVPDADIPQILADVSSGMDAVDSMVEQYGGDRSRIYLVGDSAGAFLGIYAVAARKTNTLAAAGGFQATRLPVKALGLISGMYYTTLPDSVGLFLRKDFYGKEWRNHPMRRFFDPAIGDLAGSLPPCFLVTSGTDNLRRYTLKFYRGLKSCQTPCELLDFPLSKNLQHDFVIIKPELTDAQYAIDRIVEFLLKH